MDLAAVRHLHAVQPVELGDQSVGVLLDVSVIFRQDLSEELVLGMVDGFDDILVVAREVEEATTFARRTELGEDVLAGEGHQVVGRI